MSGLREIGLAAAQPEPHGKGFAVERCSGIGPDSPAGAESGATLLEAALSIAVFGSVIALASAIVSEEHRRQRAVSVGKDLAVMTEAAQAFIAGEYGEIVAKLPALPDGKAELTIGIGEVVSAGYLPAAFLSGGERKNSFGQTYNILARAVYRLDSAVPQATLDVAFLDADGDGAVDPVLIDGIAGNGELDIESVLATSGGDAVQAQDGNPAIVEAANPFVGYMGEASIARGPLGSWVLDASPFNSLAGSPAKGRFLSLLSLSGHGVLGVPMGSGHPGGGQSHPLERCLGLSGDLLELCAADYRMYTELSFGSFDSDGDGSDDVAGSIEGLSEITCGPGTGGLHSIGTLLVDCPAAEFTGDALAAGAITAERFLAGAIGGQDLTKGVYAVDLVAMSPTSEVLKPDCADPGSSAQVFAAPSAYASPEGAALLAVAAFAEDNGTGNGWQIRMEAAVDVDEDGDGVADVIELDSTEDHALVIAKCS